MFANFLSRFFFLYLHKKLESDVVKCAHCFSNLSHFCRLCGLVVCNCNNLFVTSEVPECNTCPSRTMFRWLLFSDVCLITNEMWNASTKCKSGIDNSRFFYVQFSLRSSETVGIFPGHIGV
uniref:Putative secreted protein n=1 Tax=Ixodes scapularis TaxID=6945 RepID=A0A4D5RZH9_IXOSC